MGQTFGAWGETEDVWAGFLGPCQNLGRANQYDRATSRTEQWQREVLLNLFVIVDGYEELEIYRATEL